jgi:hypothetical protein
MNEDAVARRSSFCALWVAGSVCALVLGGCGHGIQAMPALQSNYSGPVGGPFGPVGPVSPDLNDTTVGFHAIQMWDDFHGNFITISDAIKHGVRYGAVWGSRQNTVIPWQTNNPANRPMYYTPFDTDTADGLGHPLSWWQSHHPDWILYECDKTTIAYVPGLFEVPLDFSNPAFSTYQAEILGSYVEANAYNGIGADIVDLTNNTGQPKSGKGGCGVWTSAHTWQQIFSGQVKDPAWAAAVAGWATSLQRQLHQFPRRLALGVNTPPGAFAAPVNGKGGDPSMRALFDHVDIEFNEAGFAIWGQYADSGTLVNDVGWMEYMQSKGKVFFVADDWNQQSGPPSLHQLDYSLATYMMGKEQAAALYVGKSDMYGEENFYSQYSAKIGMGCSPMYGGPNDPHYPGERIYFRKYTGAFAIANVSPRDAYRVTLPKPSYTNIEGGTVYSPLRVAPNTGYVLLTSNGCN